MVVFVDHHNGYADRQRPVCSRITEREESFTAGSPVEIKPPAVIRGFSAFMVVPRAPFVRGIEPEEEHGEKQDGTKIRGQRAF